MDFMSEFSEFASLLSELSHCYKVPPDVCLKKTLQHNDFDDVYLAALIYYEKSVPFLLRFECVIEKLRRSDIDVSYRFKTESSLRQKWERNYDMGRPLWKVCNDLIGFRMIIDQPQDFLQTQDWKIDGVDTRVVNFYNNPKSPDDGYRGVHLYFDGTSFPVELQIWNRSDAILHFYSHDEIYKNANTPELKQYASDLRQWMSGVPAPPDGISSDFLGYLYRVIYPQIGGL